MPDNANPYAAPTHYHPLPADEPLASRSRRLLGALIDGLALGLLFTALIFATGTASQLLASGERPTLMQITAWMLAGEILFLCLHGWLLFKHQQTLGKWLLDMKIVGMEQDPVPFARLLLLRYLPFHLLGQLPLLGMLVVLDPLLIFRRDRRCIHDWLAGTRVIDQRAEALV